jgi:hypothetical protein
MKRENSKGRVIDGLQVSSSFSPGKKVSRGNAAGLELLYDYDGL